MAKNKNTRSKSASKHYPVQRHIRLKDATTAVGGGRFLMASRALSATNRRLYRQSRVYSMKIDADIGSVAASNGVDVYILRDTWDLHGAYKYAMKTYYNAIKEELAVGGAKTRWHDFRVKPDFQSDEIGFEAFYPDPSTPVMDSTLVTMGEQDFSIVSDAAGGDKTFGLDRSTAGTIYSIMGEWNNKDRVDSDPASVSTSMPYAGIVEDYDESTYDHLRENGALPPYATSSDIEIWHKVGTVRQVSPDGVMKLSTGFFDAPLGLVVLVSNAFTTSSASHGLTVTFQSGNYKGVKAPAYATPVLTEEMEYEVV